MIKELMRLKCADDPLKGYELEVQKASGCIKLNSAIKSATVSYSYRHFGRWNF